MTQITVVVTREDINTGKRSHNLDCPVALAFKRASGFYLVSVPGGAWVRCKRTVDDCLKGIDTFYSVPDEAMEFIDAFDQHEPVTPFTFTSDVITAEEAYA